MNIHLTQVKNIMDQLEEINVGLLDEIIVYYDFKNFQL